MGTFSEQQHAREISQDWAGQESRQRHAQRRKAKVLEIRSLKEPWSIEWLAQQICVVSHVRGKNSSYTILYFPIA